MELNIANYPGLMANSEIIDLDKTIQAEEAVLQDHKTQLQDLVKKAQIECGHTNESKVTHEEGPMFRTHSVLDKKICKDCGHEKLKPKGSSWVVCQICWGEMKHVHTIPGQGERTFVYECQSCHHEETHT